jgi:hypothetical protein
MPTTPALFRSLPVPIRLKSNAVAIPAYGIRISTCFCSRAIPLIPIISLLSGNRLLRILTSLTASRVRPDPATFIEIFKYALKFSDLSYADNFHAYQTLSARKLLGSFGAFRGITVPKRDRPAEASCRELIYEYRNGEYRLSYSTP